MSGFSLAPARPQRPLAGTPFHSWTLPDGSSFLQFYRTERGYLLRFEGSADFEIAGTDLSVTCIPAPTVPQTTREHLYLNQVLPLLLARQGKLALHGSAVKVDDQALAFLGETGRGKSTLAAAFATSGCPFLTDDGLLLESGGGRIVVEPSHPSIRLWDDSQDALLPPDAGRMAPVHYTSKSRFVAGDELAYCQEPVALAAIYFLGPGEAAAVEVRPVAPGDAVATLLRHSFILDIADRRQIGAQFDQLTRLVNAVSCFHLDYPRCYEDLPRVMSTVRSHAARRDAKA